MRKRDWEIFSFIAGMYFLAVILAMFIWFSTGQLKW